MPIYEYACGTCAHRFETIQRASDDPLQDCPECAAPALKKLLSAPVFRLKGSGWYETDFKSGSKKNVAESGNGGGDAASKSDSSQSDSDAGKKADSTSTAANTDKTATATGG